MSTHNTDKLMKLLRLAQRGTGPEAELAMVQAQKLATRLQVDIATMDTSEGESVQREEFMQGRVEGVMVGRGKTLSQLITRILQNHFRVKCVWSTYSGNLAMVGRKSDTVFAEYLFSWLLDRFQQEWKKELKKPSTGRQRRTANSFYYGMYLGLSAKLADAEKEAASERITEIAQERATSPDHLGNNLDNAVPEAQEQAIRQQYQLATVNEADELEREYNRLHPNVRGVGLAIGSNRAAQEAGRAAGARTRIPGLPLNHSNRSSLK